MKRIFSILMMLVIFVQSTNQVWIIIGFHLNKTYIENNLCQNRFDKIPVCKGSCVLEKQLNDNDKNQEKIPTIKFKEITLFHSNVIEYHQEKSLAIIPLENNYKTASSVTTKSFHPFIFRPPNTIV